MKCNCSKHESNYYDKWHCPIHGICIMTTNLTYDWSFDPNLKKAGEK